MIAFVFGSAPDGLATFRAFVLGLVAPDRANGSRGVFAAIAGAFAVTAVPRVVLGAAGWMRALPADARDAWRAAVVSLCIAQLAALTFVPMSLLLTVVVYHATLSAAKVIALPLIIVCVAATVLPARRFHTRLLGAAGAVLAINATWLTIPGSVLCLLAADLTRPEIASTRKRWRLRSHRMTSQPAFLIWIRSSWRAMRLGGFAAATILPIILASYGYFVTRNNPTLSSSTAAMVVRVTGTLSLAAFAAGLANTLLQRRQPWPWARSLPWSSTRRVLADACVIGLPLLVVPIGLLPVRASSALAVATLVPLAAASAAAAVRGGANRLTGAAGECFVISLIAGGLMAVWPLLGVVNLGIAPLYIRLGARREREQVATKWTELHHEGAGDPGWLAGA